MSVHIYDAARLAFASASLSWPVEPMLASICPASYVPDYAAHKFLSAVSSDPTTLYTVTLTNQSLDTAGWFVCDPLIFTNCPINAPISQIVVYKDSDRGLVLNITFPPITTAVSKPFILIRALGSPGLCRL